MITERKYKQMFLVASGSCEWTAGFETDDIRCADHERGFEFAAKDIRFDGTSHYMRWNGTELYSDALAVGVVRGAAFGPNMRRINHVPEIAHWAGAFHLAVLQLNAPVDVLRLVLEYAL